MAKLDKEKVLEGISSVISLWLELKKRKKGQFWLCFICKRKHIKQRRMSNKAVWAHDVLEMGQLVQLTTLFKYT